ncbi:MAG: DUF4097 family beta strand repeat protein [Phycisphaerae bacterium]|nr:DUF4097 family beta strand repeat protein [Phycisphaerae bacterium]
MTTSTLRSFALAAFLAPALMLAACGVLDGKAERHLVTTEPAPASLEISSRFCDVTLGVATTNEVAIDASVFLETSGGNETAEREIEFVNVFVKRDGDKLIVRQGEEGQNWSFKGSYSGRGKIVVNVPANVPVSVSTASGDVTAKGDFGAINATFASASGDMSLRDIGLGSLTVRTASGDATIKTLRPVTTLNWAAASGDLQFAGGASTTRAESASGDIHIEGVTGDFTGSAASGDLFVAFLPNAAFLNPGTRLKASTASGDVTFVVPADVNPGGTISTASGSISLAPGMAADVARRNATLKGANATVEISTASGDVTLKR